MTKVPTDERAHAERLREDGWTVLPAVIDLELADALLADLDRLVADLGVVPANNGFEGRSTYRIYNLLAHGPLWEQVPVHPEVLPVVESVLDGGCLVSSLSSIDIRPGEVAQPLHADDQLLPLERPHVPIVCNTMWALTDFTEENGATRLLTGSHRAPDNPMYGQEYDTVPAEMEKGSVLVWNGSLWHGGGANRADERRVGIAMNYCAGWVRQQENQQLGIPRDVVRGFSPRLRQLVGYGIYNGLVGHIDKHDPATMLLDRTPGRDDDTLWSQL